MKNFRGNHTKEVILQCLSTYSNIHRGEGHFSKATERLLLRARETLLEYMKLNKNQYIVVFCSPLRADQLKNRLRKYDYQELSSSEFGLPFGLRALAIRKCRLPRGAPDQSGGGTVKMVRANTVVWAKAPQRFEAGTPSIIHSIAFAHILYREMSPHDCLTMPSIIVPGNDLSNKNDPFSELTGSKLMVMLRKNVIGGNLRIPTFTGERNFVNLDNPASNPTFTPVYNAVCEVLDRSVSTASGTIEEVKEICADFLGITRDKYDIIFAANTTEAINLASENFLQTRWKNTESLIVNSIQEHNSNELPWREGKYHSLKIPLKGKGILDLDFLDDLLHKYNVLHLHGKKRIRMVSVSGVSNILGIYNDIREICTIARRYDVYTLIDGAQWVAHRRISLEDNGVDCFTFSGHKIYAPFGTGVLIIRKDLINFNDRRLDQIRKSGEENIAGIAAIGKAIQLLQKIGMESIEKHERTLVKKSIEALMNIPGIRIYGPDAISSPEFKDKASLISFTLQTVPHNLLTRKLAEYGGIGVRSGCLCAHLMVQYLLKLSSLRLYAANLLSRLNPKQFNPIFAGLIRIGFGIQNDEEDVERFLEVLKQIISEPLPWHQRILASRNYGTPFLGKKRTQRNMMDFAEQMMERVFP